MLKATMFFLLIFCAALIATAPMQWVYSQLDNSDDPITLSNINGSVWSGSASVQVRNTQLNYQADNWHWDFQPLSLLSLELNWRLTHQQQKIDAEIATSAFAFGSDLNIQLHSDIQSLVPINPLFSTISGQFSAQLENFSHSNCNAHRGEVQLQQLQFMGFKLQQLNAHISCSPEGLYKISYQSQDPATNIKGSLTIDQQGSYQSSMTVSSSDSQVSEQLATLATKTLSKGKYLIETGGDY
ncbi:MAG: type II secretion system protein N [Pseudomonadales bacterium]|nr:type II secretion system protein N [Pseudomonadales bacterium]NRA18645.1 type II secretion system protein N [Oceanospirillaceae bacterium]